MSENLPFPDQDPTVLEALRNYFSKASVEVEKTDVLVAPSDKYVPNRLLIAALANLLAGQFLIEFLREALGGAGVLLLVIGMVLAAFAFLRERKPVMSEIVSEITEEGAESTIRLVWMLAAFVLAIGASQLYRQGLVSFSAGLLWIASIAAIVIAFYKPKKLHKPDFSAIVRGLMSNPRRTAAYLVLIIVVLIFQLGRLEQVPPEMISAHVEAYYSVDGISHGGNTLWFPRNVVSEPLGYYWAALLNLFTANPMSFAGLKLAYAVAGLVAVYYMFKLGKLLFDEKTGNIAALLLGVGFWPVLQQRAVLGFGLVLPIMLPAVYYLVKSLHDDDLNSLLIASVLTGLGLLTNKIFFALVIANLFITIAHFARSRNESPRISIPMRVATSLLIGLVVVLPFIFIIAGNPQGWISPIIKQVSPAVNPVGSFLNNFLSAIGMVNWSNRSSWVEGIGNRAAVDWVTGAFFLFGLAVSIFYDIRKRTTKTLTLLILFFVGLLSSALSLAQPLENPSLSRALMAVVPVMLIAARGLGFAADHFFSHEPRFIRPMVFIGVFALLIVIRNFGLINSTYTDNYQASAWNSSEMAEVIKNYDTGQGSNSQAYIIGFPHWVDARAVAISMGEPHTNLSLLPQDLASTTDLQTSKIFLLHPGDTESLSQLQSLYPAGIATVYQSVQPDKNFLIYLVSQ